MTPMTFTLNLNFQANIEIIAYNYNTFSKTETSFQITRAYCLTTDYSNSRVLMFVCVCVCVCVGVCVCVSVCVNGNSKNNGSIHLKLEHIVVHGNSLDECDIGHCLIKVKARA